MTSGALLLAVGTSGGCGNGNGGGNDFVVDNPGLGGGDYGEDTGQAGDGGDPTDDEGGDGGREISEADIVFVQGDLVYALSAFGGLAIVDASAPDQGLPVLGRHRMHAQPFEMYVDGDQVFVMTSDHGSYEYDQEAGGYTWHSSSRLLALDASDPSNIESRGAFEMPGTIQDSRRVGDVLYLVTFEDGWCWGCLENQPRTVVTSLDVSNPAQVQIVDQLAFDNDTDDAWDWAGPRSVSATDERMYVGGIEYDGWDSAHSVIDVIDISDAGGVLTKGASLEISGSIQSRWQMDEHEGALRVISQPWGWNVDAPPVVETFSVASASDIAPLASLPLVLPRPETLQSVRFDGTRGYAITFERTDPLFTIDLTDPAQPQQRGELEIPGFVHHMEPRGDRLLALGFDQGNPDGSINVSLFDVADLDQPALLSRVAFGGDWASFAEDQNRIHKAFSILDELGLVLVPFSGWQHDASDDGSEWSCGSYQSGTQLVDWSEDALVRRGVAPSQGRSRRALMHRDRLLTMSDKAIQAFDISDRDAPVGTAQVALAANVTTVAAEGDTVVRLAMDWWTSEAAIEVVSSSDAEAAEPLGRLVLAEISDEFECNRSWPVDLFVHDGFAYLVRETYDIETYQSRLVLDTIDVHDAVAPTWLGSIDLPFQRGWGSYYYGVGAGVQERSIVLHDGALVFTTSSARYEGDAYVGTEARLEVVDLSAPDAPAHTGTLARPAGLAHGDLQLQDDTLISWHVRPVDGDEEKVRFYFDRFDVSSPAHPEASTPINVPGQVVAYDAGHARVVVAGFELETIAATGDECWMHPQQWGYGSEEGKCTIAHHPLHLLALQGSSASLLDTLDVEGDEGRLSSVASAGDRVFASVREGGYYYGGVVSEDGLGEVELPTDHLVVITGQGGSALAEASRVPLAKGGAWSWLTGAVGPRALFVSDRGLGFVDASDPADPQVSLVASYGWGCYQPRVVGDTVYCPMGEYGLQVVSVP